jgi:hypothetical protein
LGEFLPFGILFALGSFLKNYIRNENFWTSILNGKSYVLNLTNNGFLGDFFTNSSGDPVPQKF